MLNSLTSLHYLILLGLLNLECVMKNSVALGGGEPVDLRSIKSEDDLLTTVESCISS
jgi:hypothetical protein